MCVEECRRDQEPECPPGLEMRPSCCSQKYCDKDSAVFCHSLGEHSFLSVFCKVIKSLEESAQECACVQKGDNTMTKCLKPVFLLKNAQRIMNVPQMKYGMNAEALVLPSVENQKQISA